MELFGAYTSKLGLDGISESATILARRFEESVPHRGTQRPPLLGIELNVELSQVPHGHIIEIADIYAPLPKDAPNSEHQRRAALIRMRKIRNGELSGSSRGGRRKISRACAQCGESCDSAREARDHCRVARKIIAE